MKNLKKIAAAAVSVALSATTFGCTPSIGGGTTTSLTIDGYEVPSGLFVYYTLQSYSEASSQISPDGVMPSVNDVKKAQIEGLDAADWIQDKATEYCRDFVAISKEFDAIGAELTSEEKDEAADIAEYYYSLDSRLEENGISLDTMKLMAENSYKEQKIFEHYYGFEGEKGCSEDELKDYFDENFARVKYVSISLLDDEGNELPEDEQRALRKKAEGYVHQINDKAREIDKMHEMDAVQEDYNEYVAAQTTAAEDEVSPETTTTTTTEESEETTTTDPYANERVVQRNTTTTKSADSAEDGTTTTAAEGTVTDDYKYKEFIFNELELNKATIYDYNDTTIYVILRGDLRERMTEDDYWSEDYIQNLQSMRYYNEYVDFLDSKAKALEITKNKSAYRRYAPFKLQLEAK